MCVSPLTLLELAGCSQAVWLFDLSSLACRPGLVEFWVCRTILTDADAVNEVPRASTGALGQFLKPHFHLHRR